jgi:hypothetical protein
MCYALSKERTNATSVIGAKAYHVALTNKRLLIIEARIGAFAPLFENNGLTVIDRSAIVGATRDDHMITLQCADGKTVQLWVVPRQRQFSNQATLVRDLPRVFQPGGAVSNLGTSAGAIRPA